VLRRRRTRSRRASGHERIEVVAKEVTLVEAGAASEDQHIAERIGKCIVSGALLDVCKQFVDDESSGHVGVVVVE
jgi:hypothetical protein